MPLRVLEVILPADHHDDLCVILDDAKCNQRWITPLDDDLAMTSVVPRSESVEPITDTIRDKYEDTTGFRTVLKDIEATFPPLPEPEDEPTPDKESDTDHNGWKTRFGRVSREELQEDIQDSAKITPVFIIMVALATIVACVGLIKDSPEIIIGAMVIAPLLGPNTALALGTTLGDTKMIRSAINSNILGLGTALAISLLVMPDRFPEPAAASGYAVAISAVCLFAFLAMSWRQLTLYWVGRHRSSIVASMGYLFLGATAMVWWQHSTFTIGWWLVHAVDVIGVTIGCFSVTRNSLLPVDVEELLTPILQRDPLVALEFGLAPVVHQFVADLDTKDPITRDHVIRTSESAMRVGQALGLPSSRLRHLGIAALLHDIGKLEVPDAVLNKPGRLDAAEFEIMQRHAASGAVMLGRVPSLAPAAPFVRGHHERIDGNGYPDGLVGDQIPLEARIISVCDAFDAMSHTRQYRTGMGTEKAQAIMREHAGSQWDPDVVEVALRVLPELHGVAPALTNVGRDRRASETEQPPVVCACADALPELVDLHA